MSLAGSIGLAVSLALLVGFGAAGYVARNSPSFSLMRLGLALEDRDPRRAARFLQIGEVGQTGSGVARDGVDVGVAVQIGSWRALPSEQGVVDLVTEGASGIVALRGRCGDVVATAEIELERVPAGVVDLTLFELPVYDWRLVGVTSASLCQVARACDLDAAVCDAVALR